MSAITLPLVEETVVASPAKAIPAPRPRLVKSVLVGADLVTITLSMVLAYRLRAVAPGATPLTMRSQHLVLGALSLPAWAAIFGHYRLYSSRFLASRLEEFRRLIHAVGTSVAAIAVVAFALQLYVARGWLVLTFVTTMVAVLAEREVARRLFALMRRRGMLLRPVVIAGGNAEGLALCELLMSEPSLGYRVVGFVDDHASRGTYLYDHRPVLGGIDDTLDAVRVSGASSVILATTAVDLESSNRLARQLTDAGVHVEMSSTLRDIDAARLTVRPLGRYPIVYVEPVRRRGWRPVAKRTFDLVVSAAVLVAGLPVLLACAIAVKLDSPGPVLFRQERVGRGGKTFRILKFRTMVRDAELGVIELRDRNEAAGPLFKLHDDPRVTRTGALLRKFSVDELPQFFNVLRGEMSIVGPRPALASEMRGWTPALHARLQVTPGITGMWQVRGRSNATFEEYTRLDLYYVDNWSLWTDLAIVAKTVPTVLLRRGAY
ncbi:MAG: putative undecaprenyl-phosphate glycosylphosphotransferase [Acidimicrobiales bacterium]|nr:putative undecaprenyl-phosphate glycosylphosphotransferase [Acidimicrobiales bacterium]